MPFDYLIQWTCGFMCGASSPSIITLPSLGPWFLWKRRYFVLNFSRELTRLHSQRVMWLYRWLPVIMGHHPAKSGVHRPCRKEDILSLNWHMTSCNHVIRKSCNFISGFASSHAITLLRLVAIHFLEKVILSF